MASNTRSTAKNRFNEDPVDELKRRSRRRLVGAIALFFAALIVVPALVENVPEQTPSEVELVLPEKPPVDQSEVQPESTSPSPSSGVPNTVVSEPAAAHNTPEKASLDLIYPSDIQDGVQVKPSEKLEQKKQGIDPSKPEPVVKAEDKKQSEAKSEKKEPEKKLDSKSAEPKKAEKTEKVEKVEKADKTEKIEKADSKSKKNDDLIAAFADEEGPAISLYWVQVAAVGDRSRAEQLRAELASKGFGVRVEAAGSLFRVRVGPFTNQDKAERVRGQLSASGHEGKVVR